MHGAKVLSLKVELFDIRFIDSLNFIPMKLANLPKTFGIEELAKGHFPHFFNKKENENCVGPIAPVTYYNPDGMNPITFPKIRLASFRPWDIPPRRNSLCLRTNGYRIRPRSAKFIFNTHATAARNASVIISSTVITKKRILRSKSTAVSGADARNVTPAKS